MRKFLLGVLLLGGLAVGVVGAQQSNVTNAVVIAALQAMGLFGDGYSNGQVPAWSTASNQYVPTANGGGAITPTSVGVPASTCAAPGIYLTTATTTGMAFTATPSVIICVNGVAVVTTSGTAVTSTVPYVGPAGSATATTFNFGTAGTGFYQFGVGQIGWASAGTLVGVLTADGLAFGITSPSIALNDVSLSRGAANRLDLASGDSLRVVSGDIQFGSAQSAGGAIRLDGGDAIGWRTAGSDWVGYRISSAIVAWNAGTVNPTAFNFTAPLRLDNVMFVSNTAPTVTSAGTSPSVAGTNTAAFRVNVGTGGTATTIVMAMPAATAGWNCFAENITATAANRVDQRVVLQSSSTTAVTVQNQTVSTGAALAFTASDIVAFTCTAY